MAIGVYKIELNDKIYVGSTTQNFKKRWNDHLSTLRRGDHCNKYLQNAYNKHGEESLKFSILEIINTPEEAIITEQRYIDNLGPEYNICPVAGNTLGRNVTKEIRQKLSKAGMGNKNSSGYHHTEEARRKIGKSSKGRCFGIHLTEEARKARSEALTGRHLTSETKKKMSESAKLRWQKRREATA